MSSGSLSHPSVTLQESKTAGGPTVPDTPEKFFESAVLLIAADADRPVDTVLVDYVLQHVPMRQGHGLDLGRPGWRERISMAMLGLEQTGLLEWTGLGYVPTPAGMEVAASAGGCGEFRSQVKHALQAIGVAVRHSAA